VSVPDRESHIHMVWSIYVQRFEIEVVGCFVDIGGIVVNTLSQDAKQI
jgi:hypothetical protein